MAEYFRSRIRRASRSVSRRCRAARASKPTPFSSSELRRVERLSRDSRNPPSSVGRSLAGVGPKVAERLAKLGVRTLGDLLCLLPQRYEDRTRSRRSALSCRRESADRGNDRAHRSRYTRRRSLLAGSQTAPERSRCAFSTSQVLEQDTSSAASACGATAKFAAGRRVSRWSIPSTAPSATTTPAETTLTPVYPTTEGLYQQALRRLVAGALAALEHQTLEDYLAPALASQSLGRRAVAVARCWHSRICIRPPRDAATELLLSGRHPCSRRIALEELVAQRLSLRRAAAVRPAPSARGRCRHPPRSSRPFARRCHSR